MHARIDTKRYLKLSRQSKKLCGTPEGPEAKFPDSHFKDLLLPNLDSVFPFVSLCVYANFVRVHIHYYSREYACMYISHTHHITHTFENIHIYKHTCTHTHIYTCADVNENMCMYI